MPPTTRSISAVSEIYIALDVPGFGATLTAPGMWLMANSKAGLASNTVALFSCSVRRSSSVEISGVFALSPKVALCMVGADWAAIEIASSKKPKDNKRRFMMLLLTSIGRTVASLTGAVQMSSAHYAD